MSPTRRKATGRKPARARRRSGAAGKSKAKSSQPKARSRVRPKGKKPKPPSRRRRSGAPGARERATRARKAVRAKAAPKPRLESLGAAPEAIAGLLDVVEVRDFYTVSRGQHVFATANVDAAQLGELSLFINETKLGDFTAPMASLDLGLADDLIDKLLRVEAIVSDVMKVTDALRLRLTLTGGPAAKTIPVSADTEENGGSVKFRIFVLLRE